MDDNARPHRALAVEELLETRLHHPENTQQLKQMLIEELALLPQEMLHQLVLSMRRRCEATIAKREESGRPAKRFEDAELQALLDEDDGQTQEHLAEELNVDQSTVSRRLKAMGKILKVGRWVPLELTDRQQESRKVVCEMLLAPYKCKSYLYRIVTGDEKWIYFENPKRNRSYVDPDSRPNQPQGRIASAARQCYVFPGIRRDQSIMSFSNPAKPLILIATSNNYLI
ncbi:mariner Mos1 transposase [Trichonephila clavipes]|nr:mariner Mos1 transposase [Trichonephila clavipes]